MLANGVPFSNAFGIMMEYSNFGYATLGRIITNVSGRRYQDDIRDTLMRTLGMTSTGYDIGASPQDRRAIGYRRQDHAWLREPDLAVTADSTMAGKFAGTCEHGRIKGEFLLAPTRALPCRYSS